jgi:hypothetical protein
MSKPTKSQWNFGELFPTERTQHMLSVIALALLIFMNACCPFWNPACARSITYGQFNVMYYQTNPERTKAYLFFSPPKPNRWIVGMGEFENWEKDTARYSIFFGGVPDTGANRKKFPFTAKQVGNLWMMELDMPHLKTGDQFKMFYATKDSFCGIEIPFKGIKSE